MNEKLQIVFGLLGGLAIFLYGMNMMSECLQKAAGEKMKTILALLTWCFGRCTYNSSASEQQCNDSYGNWFCQCRTYESATGNFDYIRCKYRYDNDSSDYRI